MNNFLGTKTKYLEPKVLYLQRRTKDNNKNCEWISSWRNLFKFSPL